MSDLLWTGFDWHFLYLRFTFGQSPLSSSTRHICRTRCGAFNKKINTNYFTSVTFKSVHLATDADVKDGSTAAIGGKHIPLRYR